MQSTEREDKGARQLLLSLWFVCHRSSRVTPPSTRTRRAGGRRARAPLWSRTSVIVRLASYSKLKASEQRAAPLKWGSKGERFHSRSIVTFCVRYRASRRNTSKDQVRGLFARACRRTLDRPCTRARYVRVHESSAPPLLAPFSSRRKTHRHRARYAQRSLSGSPSGF